MSETLEELLERGGRELADRDRQRAASARVAARLLCRLCEVPASLDAYASVRSGRDGGWLDLRVPGCVVVSRQVRRLPPEGENGQEPAPMLAPADIPARDWEAGALRTPSLAEALAYARQRQAEADEYARHCAPDPLRSALEALVWQVMERMEFSAEEA